MAQLELVTMNPPTGEGFEGLEPIRVPKSSIKAWTRRGWTLAEEPEDTQQGTNAQGSTEASDGTPAPAVQTQKTNKPSTAPENTTTAP